MQSVSRAARRLVLQAALAAVLVSAAGLIGCGGGGDGGDGGSRTGGAAASGTTGGTSGKAAVTGGEAAGTVGVFVSILPQRHIVLRIGGDPVRVKVMVQPGESPHTYSPSPRQFVALGESDVYFTLGLPFERRLIEKIRGASPDLMIVPADEGVERRMMQRHAHGEESHGEEAAVAEHGEEASEHEGEPDPHIWLGPDNLARIARNTRDGLARAAPSHGTLFDSGLDGFLSELEAVDRRIQELLAPYRGRKIFVFHPAFGYFADAYGLEQVPIELEGKSPTPRLLEALITRARRENVRIIFVQAQFDQTAARKVAEAIGGAVVPLDPLAPNVLENLREIADRIEAALR